MTVEENSITNIELNSNMIDSFNPVSIEECTIYFKIGANMASNGLLLMGKMALCYRERFAQNTDEFNQWCENTLQFQRQTAGRLIRIYEASKQSNLVESFAREGFNIRKLDTILQLGIVEKESKEYKDYGKNENVIKKDKEGVRQYDLTLVEDFLSKYPDFETMKLKDIQSIVKEYKEANGLIKKANIEANNIKKQAEKDAQNKRDIYNQRLAQLNKREQEIKQELERLEKNINLKIREKESSIEEREEIIKLKEEQFDIKESKQLKYINELEQQIKELENTRESLDIDILTNKRMLNKLSSEQEKINFIDDTLNAQQIVKQNLQILLKDDMIEYLQTDLINPKITNGLTEVILICDKLIKRSNKNKNSTVVDVKDLIIVE